MSSSPHSSNINGYGGLPRSTLHSALHFEGWAGVMGRFRLAWISLRPGYARLAGFSHFEVDELRDRDRTFSRFLTGAIARVDFQGVEAG